MLRKTGAGDEARTRNFQPGEAEFSILYFQHLQNRVGKIHVHALRAVHALPDLRVVAGRLRDGVSFDNAVLPNSTS